MTALAEAFVAIRADSTKMPDDIRRGTTEAVSKAAPTITEHGKRLGGHLGGGMRGALSGLGGSLLAGLGGGLIAGGIMEIGGSLTGLVNDARAGAAAARITAQVIKTTGGAAHISAAQVDDLATSISNKTGVDDDAVRSGANMLLTFTNVRNEVGKGNDIFNQAAGTVTDMSVALGQDAKGSAIQLGKALNDPIKGVTALQKVGVSFTEDQKKQIATLVKHGNVLGAQKVILKELGHEFGGAAAAASDPMKKLGVTLGNTGKELAGYLLPYLDKAATWLNSTGIPAFKTFAAWLGQHVGPVIGQVGGFVSTVLMPALSTIGTYIMTTVIPVVKNLAAGFMTNVLPALMRVWAMIASNLQPVLTELGTFWSGTLMPLFQRAWPIIQKIVTVLGFVAAAVGIVVSWLIGKLVPVLTTVIGWVVNLTLTFVDFIATALIKGATFIGWFVALPGKIATAISGLWDGLKNGFKAALNWIIDRWNSFPKMNIPGIDVGPVHYGGGTIGLPTLPHLATGGVVPATRGGRLIVAGEGGEDEIVAPESKLRKMLAGRGSGPLVYVDARGADAATAARFEATAARIAREVIYGIALEVSY